MSEKRIVVRLEDDRITLDIPGEEDLCTVELSDIVSKMHHIIPEGNIETNERSEKEVVEVNVGFE